MAMKDKSDDTQPLVGRESELRILGEAMRSRRSEFIAVYGRRRVGKTFLVRRAFDGKFAFQHSGLSRGGKGDQLEAFADSMHRCFGIARPSFRSWIEAFGALADALEATQGRKVVLIDELPWLDTPNSRFMPALEHFWNGWASGRDDIVFVVCGSAASWIVRKVIDNYGGLHNRLTHRLRLVPFTLHECRSFARSRGLALTDRQIAELYMAFGGIPLYWDLVRKDESPAQAIDRLCFSENGDLHGEFNRLYASLFRRPEPYIAVVKALARRNSGMTRDELLDDTGFIDNGAFSGVVADLESCGFIRKYGFPGKVERDAIWQLVDPFTLFHMRFLSKTSASSGGNWLAGVQTNARSAWSGLAFEELCLSHVRQIKAALGISGVTSSVYAARIPPGPDGEPGAQIDLAIDRADGIVNLCEMKFSEKPFAVTGKYRLALLDKVAAWRRAFGSKKAIHVTFVASAGVKPGGGADAIQSEVGLSDLFRPAR